MNRCKNKNVYRYVSIVMLFVFFIIEVFTIFVGETVVLLANDEDWKVAIRESIDKIGQLEEDIDISNLNLSDTRKNDITEYLVQLKNTNNYYWVEDMFISGIYNSRLSWITVTVKPYYYNDTNGINKDQAKKDFDILQQRLLNGEWDEIIKERVNKIEKVDNYDLEWIEISDLKIDESNEEKLVYYFNELRTKNSDYYWIEDIYFEKENGILIDAFVWIKPIYVNENRRINKVKAKKDFENIQQRIASGEWKELLYERIEESDVYQSEYGQLLSTCYIHDIAEVISEKEIFEFISDEIHINPSFNYIKEVKYNIEACCLEIILKPNFVNWNLKIDKDEAIREYFVFKERLSSLFINFNNTMSDIDKTLAIYDWVMRETEYDYLNYINNTVPWISGKAEGVFNENLAVCSGYTAAVAQLLDKARIENYQVESSTMDHTWNVVKLGQYYYHLDATWDDYGNDDKYEGIVCHEDFIKADSEFENLGHCNWTGGPECKNENSFMNYIFREHSDTNFSYYNGFWYYVVGNEIIKSKIDGSQKSVFKNMNETLVNMFIYKKSMYIATETNVYKIDMSNEASVNVLFNVSESSDKKSIDEFVIKGDKIKIDCGEFTKYISLKPTSTIKLDKTIVEVKEGDTIKINAQVKSEYASKAQWASTNNKVATVDSEGNIKAKSAGETTVYASVDGIIVECKVVVDNVYMNGDINCDEKIDTQDAVLLKKYLAGDTNVDISESVCDINQDGSVNSSDAVILLKYLAGYDIEL